MEIARFEGARAETKTILTVLDVFRNRHGLAETPMVIAADTGMLSAGNLSQLDEAGMSFIVGSRTVKAPGDLAFHWHGGLFIDGQIIDTVTPHNAKSTVNDRKPLLHGPGTLGHSHIERPGSESAGGRGR